MKRTSPAAMADLPEFPPPAPLNQRKKKTRELPNLSDCHCCNRRINNTNPKNRLRILTSEWRIVLLCKSCHSLVESSQYCAYCLTRVSSSLSSSLELFYECKRCHRRIHKECISKFSFGPGNSSDFSVCFDCCVPKYIENEYYSRIRSSIPKRKGVKVGGESTTSLGSSAVCNSQDKGKILEDVVNDANFVAQKKIAAAVDAVVARTAVELANGAWSCVPADEGGAKADTMVDNDAQLAIRLHRAMNSSPRISRNSCLLNSRCVNVPKVNGGNSNGLTPQLVMETSCSSKSVGVGGDAFSRDKDSMLYGDRNGLCLNEKRQECGRKCGRTQDEKCNGDSDGCLITYTRKGRAPMEVKCKEEPDSIFEPSIEVKCKEEPDSSPRTCSREWASLDIRCKEEPDCFLRTYSRRPSQVERRNKDLGHCSKTYNRRHSANGKSKLLFGTFNLDNGTLVPAVALNYREE